MSGERPSGVEVDEAYLNEVQKSLEKEDANEARRAVIKGRMAELRSDRYVFVEHRMRSASAKEEQYALTQKLRELWERDTDKGREYAALREELAGMEEPRPPAFPEPHRTPELTAEDRAELAYRAALAIDIKAKKARIISELVRMKREPETRMTPDGRAREAHLKQEGDFLDQLEKHPGNVSPQELVAFYARKQTEAYTAEKEAAAALTDARERGAAPEELASLEKKLQRASRLKRENSGVLQAIHERMDRRGETA